MAQQDESTYQRDLEARQLALVNWQQHAIKAGQRALIIFEGRDAAGKDGSIRAVTQHLSTRNTRVVALAKPTERERSQWYFQRYLAHLPSGGEAVIFNRSWYNRAGVERVMGFATRDQQEAFLDEAPKLEAMLVESGIRLVKLWLDVSKEEQAVRLERRRTDPLKALKTSPLDEVAQSKWDDYTGARDAMLRRTSTPDAPWICVRADKKKRARLAILSHLVHALAPHEIAANTPVPDPKVLFRFEEAALTDGRLRR